MISLPPEGLLATNGRGRRGRQMICGPAVKRARARPQHSPCEQRYDGRGGGGGGGGGGDDDRVLRGERLILPNCRRWTPE